MMIRIAVVGEIGSGKTFMQSYLVFQFLTQIMRYKKFIKKIELLIES